MTSPKRLHEERLDAQAAKGFHPLAFLERRSTTWQA